MWGGDVPLPTGEGSGEGAVPPPQKNFAIFASKSHVFDALRHPFEVILLLVENEQQCTKWFILQCYNQICSRIQVKTHSTMLAIAPVEVDDDGDIFERQRINGTDRIFVR